MENITVIASDKDLRDLAVNCCDQLGDDAFHPIFVNSTARAIESLNYDLPRVTVIKLHDEVIDSMAVVNALKIDPWLQSRNVIVVHNYPSDKEVYETFKDINLVAAVHEDNLEKHFFRVLSILQKHKQMIFQADIQGVLTQNLSCSFELDNDPFDTHIYANIIENFLFNMNLLKQQHRGSISVVIIELLMNAIEHGNCGITFDEKTQWLEQGKTTMELVEERNQKPWIAAKKVQFSYNISHEKSVFTITDEGKGFDHKKFREKKEVDVFAQHGRGIAMADLYTSELHYNDIGNACTFELYHQENKNNTVPIIFKNSEVQEYTKGDIIFHEDEESDDLYYIVSGKFNIFAGYKLISTLDNNDIFLGEMSFLLNSKRSATVIAACDAKLIPISKYTFVNAIKEHPHYGIMLARLLAQRLDRSSQHI